MSWLLRNNWLWSLLAFALGAAITWYLLDRRPAAAAAVEEPSRDREKLLVGATIGDSTHAVRRAEPPLMRVAKVAPVVRAAEPDPAVRAKPTPAGRAPEPEPVGRVAEPDPAVRAEPAPVGRAAEPDAAERAEPDPTVRVAEADPVVRAQPEPADRAEPEPVVPAAPNPVVRAEPEPNARVAEPEHVVRVAQPEQVFSQLMEPEPMLFDQMADTSPAEPQVPTMAPPGRYGEGSADAVPHQAPPDGFTIKGNAQSMLFHTPDSPYYGRTKPQVWFRTESDAERAGFTKYTRRPRKSANPGD